jgi:type I restriction enzyme S subunit
MNPSQLLAHFDRLAEAPDAIPRLRRFILDLAVRGKLVEQDPNDEPACKLLKRLQAEKARLMKEGKASDVKPSRLATPEDQQYAIPAAWQWERLGNLVQSMANGIYKPSGFYADDGVLCLRMYNIKDGHINFDNPKRITLTDEELNVYRLMPGDLLVNRVNSKELVGKAACIPPCEEEVIFESKNIRLRLMELGVLPPYISLLFQTLFYRTILEGHAKQACGQATVNQPQLAALPVPFPPLAEQHRIVAKVDELMGVCDRLEAAQAQRERRRDRLAAASLHRLNRPDDNANTKAFRAHARFHLDHLPRLTVRPDQIPALRQTILNLAVRGRLVPQDRNDGSAAQLFTQIQTMKERLAKDGTIRREKPLPHVAKDELPFEVPASWAWTRIGTCSLTVEYGTSVKSHHIEDGVPVLKMGDIQAGRVLLGGQKMVPKTIDDLPQLFLKRFDLLYNRTNSAELVGKTGIFLGDDDTYTFASYLIRLRFCLELTSAIYVNLAMNAPYFRETQIVPELNQQCGQANVNGTKLRHMLVPLPPLAEQRRIVAKVDELMAVCDRLESQLTAAQTESRRLLEAVLHEALDSTPKPNSKQDKSRTKIGA